MRRKEEYNWKGVWREEMEQLRGSSMQSDITRPERGPEIPEILKSVLKCPEIH